MNLREARLQAVLRLVPPIQLFTLVDAVLLSWYFWDEVGPGFLVSWTAAMALHGLFWWQFALRTGRGGAPVSPHRWKGILVHAGTEAFLFSVFIIVVFPLIPPEKAVVLGAFVTGLLAAGALSKMTIPAAAYLFVAALTAGAGTGFFLSALPSPWVAELMLGAFAVALSVLVGGMSKVFDARVEAELEVGRQKALVSDLLEDFGESTSEGLWETDSAGRITLATPRLVSLFGLPAGAALGLALTDATEWRTLTDRGTPFRNAEVPVETPGGRRWWSLTGKPLKEGDTVVGWRGVASDVTDHRQRELEMLRLSRYDGLTGLLNRRSFRAMIDELFEGKGTPGTRCLVLIDVVGFKDVNEARGHAFGDALLAAVAGRLRATVPGRLILARLDGDEFALQGTVGGVDVTLEALGRLMGHLTQPYHVAGDRFEASFQMGVSFLPTDADSPDQWLRCTDLALRAAKTGGRNRILAYEPAMMDQFVERNLLREDLRSALGKGEIFLEYQPIVDLIGGRITGFEALARWKHPRRGLVFPALFIPLAEETEVILDLGLWVLEEACRAARGWPEEVSISVNVSGVQMRTGSLATQVVETLDRVGLSPQRLILEVTESALVKDDGALLGTFQVLKDRGVRWALDDFGTGYSSLSYLQDFPFDKLKIDQSFVRPVAGRTPSAALLGAIVSLARSLGLTTTAEGIEDRAHRDLLRSLGCQKGQGYLFSRPVPADRVGELFELDFQ